MQQTSLFRRASVSTGVVLILLLGACSDESEGGTSEAGQAESPAASGTAPAGDVTADLFAFGFGYDTGDDVAKSRVDVFRELYPDATVSFSESGFDSQIFLSALASGDPPDLVNIPRNDLGTYIERGVLAPLDDCIEQQNIDTSIYYEAGLDQVTVDGTMYAFPEFFNTRHWLFNTSVFEEAGMDPADIDLSDWDAIAEANEQLTQMEDDRVTRIGLDPKMPEYLPLWSWANNAPMISDNGLEVQLGEPGVAEALSFASSLHEPAGGRTAFLDFRDTWDPFGSENQYALDQIGGALVEQWYLDVLAEASPDDGITLRSPETVDGEPITWADGISWAITAESDNYDAACAFASTMVSTDTWVAAAENRVEERAAENLPNTGIFTGNSEADDIIFSEIVDLSDYPNLDDAVQTVLEVQDDAFALPPSPAGAEFIDAYMNAATTVLNGEGEAETQLQQAQETAQEAIDDAVQ